MSAIEAAVNLVPEAEAKRKPGRPRKAETSEATQAEAPVQAVVTPAPAAPGTDLAALVLQMAAQIKELQDQQAKSNKNADLGPPVPIRSKRPHIMVWVTPDTQVRVEVSQSYIDEKKPGWDGTPIKG